MLADNDPSEIKHRTDAVDDVLCFAGVMWSRSYQRSEQLPAVGRRAENSRSASGASYPLARLLTAA
jgi:hypothetical protein